MSEPEKDPYEPLWEPPKPSADKIFWGAVVLLFAVVMGAFGIGAQVHFVTITALLVFIVGGSLLVSGLIRAANTIDMLGKQLLINPDEKL